MAEAEPGVQNRRPQLELDDVFLLTDEPRLLRLPDSNEARNQRLDEQFGDQVRELRLEDQNRLSLDGRPSYQHNRVSNRRRLYNVVFQNPDAQISPDLLKVVFQGVHPSSVVTDSNLAFYHSPIVERIKVGNKIFYGLAADLKLVDVRSEADFARAPDPPLRRRKRTIEQAAPKVSPTSKLIGATATAASPIQVRFIDRSVVDSRAQSRYGVIGNIPAVNRETQSRIAQMARRRPDRPPIRPKELVFVNDTLLEIDNDPYEDSPLARRVMHLLLDKYFGEPLLATELDDPAATMHKHTVQLLLKKLVVRDLVFAQGKHNIDSVHLKPVIITDKRLENR